MKSKQRIALVMLFSGLLLSNLLISGMHALSHETEHNHAHCDHQYDHETEDLYKASDFQVEEEQNSSCSLCSYLKFIGDQGFYYQDSGKILVEKAHFVFQEKENAPILLPFFFITDRAPPFQS